MMANIFPPESKPFGLTYEEYIIKDWKRNLSIPVDKNPLEDNSGERVTYGVDPNSPLLYLSGNTGGTTERTCKVPSGLGVFISVCDAVYSEAEKPGSSTEDLHTMAKKDQDNVTDVSLKINGKDIADLKKYRFHTDPFDVVIPDNAVYGLRPGTSKAVADGYYVITEPFTPGNYTVVTKANISEPTWHSDVKYNLVVE